jgi:hypothetical protein
MAFHVWVDLPVDRRNKLGLFDTDVTAIVGQGFGLGNVLSKRLKAKRVPIFLRAICAGRAVCGTWR